MQMKASLDGTAESHRTEQAETNPLVASAQSALIMQILSTTIFTSNLSACRTSSA